MGETGNGYALTVPAGCKKSVWTHSPERGYPCPVTSRVGRSEEMPAAADAAMPCGRARSRSRAQGRLICRALEPLERRLLLTRFAVIADMVDNTGLANVASMVKGWNPAHILTAGDNDNLNHTDYESTVGQHFHAYMSPYLGNWGAGSSTGNRFWGAMGNHDWESSRGSAEYTDYFTLPNNERYYNIKLDANTEFFVVDSDPREPHGTSATSTQGSWVRERMLASSAKWKIVIAHHPPYSSAGSSDATWMRWPFKDWGATAVISGHHHLYERLSVNGLAYFINGPAGGNIGGFGTIDSNSIVRYNGDFGAMQIDTSDSSIVFRFFRRTGALIDSLTIDAPATGTVPAAPSALSASATSQTAVALAWADKSSDETGFKIERSATGTGNWAQIEAVGAGVTTFTDTGRTAGTTYYYRVRAYNAAGDSAYSNTAQATMPASTGTTATVLIAPGAVWRYLDNGTDQGAAWRATSFDASTWKSGTAQLGYGDGDEATVVTFGSSSSDKFITTYFRKSFEIADPAAIAALDVRLIRDDGAVVYLNGTEVWRNNMPSGTIGYTTPAASAISGTGESTWLTQSLSPALLVAGNNVLAVEIHQDRADSSDISFDFELAAGAGPAPAVTATTRPPAPMFFSFEQVITEQDEEEEDALAISWHAFPIRDSERPAHGSKNVPMSKAASSTRVFRQSHAAP